VLVRRVTYQDTETLAIYVYLTNLPVSLPPGIVALLYKSRWNVEKVFEEFKNKLGETKSWGSSANAKTSLISHSLISQTFYLDFTRGIEMVQTLGFLNSVTL